MLLLEHISTTAVVDHLRVKISSAVSADLLLEKFSTPVGIDRSRMLIHALWLFAKSDKPIHTHQILRKNSWNFVVESSG